MTSESLQNKDLSSVGPAAVKMVEFFVEKRFTDEAASRHTPVQVRRGTEMNSLTGVKGN